MFVLSVLKAPKTKANTLGNKALSDSDSKYVVPKEIIYSYIS